MEAIESVEQFTGVFAHKGDVRIKDDFFFVDTHYDYNVLGGAIGDTWFDVYVPKSIDFDAAMKICRDLISTAELVDVQYELDVIRQAEN
jgi:hypothetical protein